jgi:aminoglycoside 6-adenylyltransferase
MECTETQELDFPGEEMDQVAQAYENLIRKFIDWASGEQDIRAALVIGSRARVDHPADEWADLDIVVVTKNPDYLLASTDWLVNIGVPRLTFLEPTAAGDEKERRVLFEGGLDVDFAVIPYDKIRTWLAPSNVEHELALALANAFGRGMRVLLDKEGQINRLNELLAAVELPPSSAPTQQMFLETVNDFWYHTVWTAKHLRRGELWWAKSGCDGSLKDSLRQMLEWHAQATKGASHKTWFRGRFLEQWADPRALEQLGKAFAHYDEDDVWQALFVTMDIFRWLSSETAQGLGYSYPRTGEVYATELVKGLFSGKS